MRPAFSSPAQAAAFLLLLLFLLAAPWLADKTFLPSREPTNSSQSYRFEKNFWAQKFIFGETNDIDIAFIGSSHIGADIDTPWVQEKLDQALGHKTVVRTITFFYPGFDELYFITKDLLEHRRVKTLVFYDECSSTHNNLGVNRNAPFWYRFGSDPATMSGLPMRQQAVYYFAAVIGMPRNFLEWMVPNLPNDPSAECTGPFAYLHAANPETTLGCVQSRLGFDPTYENKATNFMLSVPNRQVTPAEVSVFPSQSATNFYFSNKPVPDNQIYFAKKFALLAKAHGCQLVELHLPVLVESTSNIIVETRNWADMMPADVCLLGVSGGLLFRGLSATDIEGLYSDPEHMNLSGEKYFTPLITPALIKFYEDHCTR